VGKIACTEGEVVRSVPAILPTRANVSVVDSVGKIAA
jgi:hypothetical protein